MKLLRLEMCALGPFAAREVVDFGALSAASLVLINGPTGAGKTTILDAVCLALYGESSGSSRDVKSMRCDRAPAQLLTEVSLDFQIGSAVYRVRRVPPQTRPRKDGKGTTPQSHEAFLYGPNAEAQLEELVEQGAKQVDARLIQLLGLDVEQFRHVIMLPQGKFRRFLEASSRDREAVLHSLFDTRRFARLADHLGAQARELHAQLKRATEAQRTLLELAEVDDAEELVAQSDALAVELKAARASEPMRRKALDKAEVALKAGEQVAALFQERDGAREEFKRCEVRVVDTQETRERLAAARRAAPLSDSHRAAQARHSESESAADALALAVKAFARADKGVGQAQRALESATEKAANIGDKRSELARLQQLTEPVSRIGAAREMLTQATQALAALELESERNQAERQEAQQAQQALEAQRDTVLALASLQEGRKDAHARIVDRHAQRKALLGVEAHAAKLSAELDVARGTLVTAKAAVLDARDALGVHERAWRAGQAGVLAQGLERGSACPVCGSEDHPAPAPETKDMPTDASLAQCKGALASAEASRDAAAEIQAQVDRQVAQVTGQRESALAQLGEFAALDLETIEIRVSHAQRELLEATRAGAQLEELGAKLAGAQTQLKKLGEASEAVSARLQAARSKEVAARTSFEALSQSVPQGLRDPQALHAQVTRLERLVASLEQGLELANTQLQETKASREAARAHVQAAEAANERALATYQKAKARLIAQRVEAKLEAEQAWAQAKVDVAKLDELTAEIESVDAGLRAARLRQERADSALEGLKAPEVEALRANKEAAEAAHTLAVKHSAQLAEAHKARTELLAEHNKRGAASIELHARYGLVSSVADVAEGKTTRVAAKVSFQRFVLAVYLDEVLLSASGRLSQMSEGRYTLQRTVAAGRKSSAAGLELAVNDAYTGKARDVSTLSGGEGFLTALALSLALADIATAQSGGIHLDTLFVDEGFGTLDADALEHALEMLAQLNRGGRMVALISHVPELKERITSRIDVTTSPAGSHTTLVIG